MINTYTENMTELGTREEKLLQDLLKSWAEQGLPEGMSRDCVRPAFNSNSGYVFLTNNDCQVAMMNGESLERWFSCSECGNEGFAEDVKTKSGRCNYCHKKDTLI